MFSIEDVMPEVYARFPHLKEEPMEKLIKAGLRKVLAEMGKGEEIRIGEPKGRDGCFMVFRRFSKPEIRDWVMRNNFKRRRKNKIIEEMKLAKKEREKNGQASS